MPDAILLNLNSLSDAMVATSLVKRLIKDGYIVYSVSDEAAEPVFIFSGAININASQALIRSYDLAINLSPTFICADIMLNIIAKKKLGYGIKNNVIEFYNDGAKRHYESRLLGIETKSNLFQLVYALADLTWQGEGYGIGYFPRNKTRKNLTGLAIKDYKLNEFVNNNLILERSKIWKIPFKKNILKQIDELNRCKQIVTDDTLMLHLGLAFRKNVEFILFRKLPYKIELFGSGNVHLYEQYEEIYSGS